MIREQKSFFVAEQIVMSLDVYEQIVMPSDVYAGIFFNFDSVPTL
jgi:hypothetical protein